MHRMETMQGAGTSWYHVMFSRWVAVAMLSAGDWKMHSNLLRRLQKTDSFVES